MQSNSEAELAPAAAGKSFKDLNLRPEVLKRLDEVGYSSMFPIQEQAIPHLLAGKDLVGQAHTGSGKTAAYAIPIIEKVDGTKPYVQALVVVPTRELAVQVTEEFNKISRYTHVRAFPIYGGVAITPQIERLEKKTPQVVVATPGRLIDHMDRGTIDFQDIRFVVLDEADRMLDMGFIDDVDFILKKVPSGAQTALFSATMPPAIVRLADRYMNHAVDILIDSDELSVDEIDQSYAIVDERSKFAALIEYIRKNKISSGIMFCSTKIKTQRLAERLQVQGFRAAPIHGDLSQNRREHAMENFRNGRIEILVATDVAARGIDVPEVGHVINYDVPQDPLTYFHRIGRTARAGRNGKAISLVANSEYPDFSRIVGMTEAQIKRVTDILPAGYKPPVESPSSGVGRQDYRYRGGGRRGGKDFSRREGGFRRRDESHQQGGTGGGGFSFTERVASGGGGGRFSGEHSRGGPRRPSSSGDRFSRPAQSSSSSRRPRRYSNYHRQ